MLPLPERQLHDRRPVEVMRPVDPHDRPVQVVVLGKLDRRLFVAVAVGARRRDPLREGVRDVCLDAVGETPLERHLQGVVMAVANRADDGGPSGSAKHLVERTAE